MFSAVRKARILAAALATWFALTVATPGIVAVASAQQTSAAGAVSNEPIVERNWGSFFRGMACGVSVGVAISTGGAAIAGAVVICTLTLASECE